MGTDGPDPDETTDVEVDETDAEDEVAGHAMGLGLGLSPLGDLGTAVPGVDGITARKAGKPQQEYLKVTMDETFITDV